MKLLGSHRLGNAFWKWACEGRDYLDTRSGRGRRLARLFRLLRWGREAAEYLILFMILYLVGRLSDRVEPGSGPVVALAFTIVLLALILWSENGRF